MPDALENALVMAVAVLLTWTMVVSTDWQSEALVLISLAAVTVAFSTRKPARVLLQKGQRECHFRAGASDGLAIGCCSPILLLSVISVMRVIARTPVGPLRTYFWAAHGCAIQPVLFLILGGTPVSADARTHILGILFGTLPGFIFEGRLSGAIVLATAAVHAGALDWSLVRVKACFTLGEASTLAQGTAILLVDAVLMTVCEKTHWMEANAALCGDRRTADMLAAEALLAGGVFLTALIACTLAFLSRIGAISETSPPHVRSTVLVSVAALLLSAVLLPWLSSLVRMDAFDWLLGVLTESGRPMLIAYWGASIPLACVLAVRLAPERLAGRDAANGSASHCAASCEPAISPTTSDSSRRARLLLARKVYHWCAVAMFAPGVLLQPDLLRVALAGVLPVFLVLELVRVADMPPLAKPLSAFLTAFLDARDQGTLILTHIYLLLGCAVPIWLDACLPRNVVESEPAAALRAAAPHAGVLVLGVGDAMASVVGVRFGRTRWPSSRKTYEGSVAGVCSMLCVLALLLGFGSADGPSVRAPSPMAWLLLASCTVLACALEAVTSQIDNLFLPLFYQATLLIAAALIS